MKSTPIRNLMLRIIVWGLIASVALAAVAGVIGYVAVGMPGLYSALIGAAVSFLSLIHI